MNKNILANIAGRFWSLVSNFLFIPLYIQLLGLQNYSIIAFSLIVAGVMAILDAGLSVTISREMARADVDEGSKYGAFRTLEAIYLSIVLVCGIAGLLFSGIVAREFLAGAAIDEELLVACLKIMVLEAGLQIFFRFYVSALMGLEKQVEANAFNIGWGVMRNGVVVAAILVSPTLLAFFVWQLISTLLLLVMTKVYAERSVRLWRHTRVPSIDWDALRRIRRFTAGVFLISVVAVVNTQLDRLAISHLMELQHLGYYTLAVSLGTGMLAVSSPFVAAIQPRLTRWFSEQRAAAAASLYLRATTIVAILLFPLMAVIAVHGETVVTAWTGDAELAARTAAIVPSIVVAYALLSMSSMTFTVALANGFTRYNTILGLVSLLVSIPGYWLMVGRFGEVGAAAVFLVIQFGGAMSLHVLIERRFLKLGLVRTSLQLWLIPAACSVLIAVAMAEAIEAPARRLSMLIYLAGAYLIALLGTGALMTALFRIRWNLRDLLEVGRGE